jgi:twitching motility two-component system response regulator PilG
MGNNVNVLVIDDSPTVCEIIKISLRREGYTVECCSSGEQALYRLASPQSSIPDLILVDICLPQMDGYDLIRFLRSRAILVEIPVVVVSRRSGTFDVLRGKLLGANAHVEKPFAIDDLLSVVQCYVAPLRPDSVSIKEVV